MDAKQLTTFCRDASNAAGPKRIHAMLHERVEHRATGGRIRADRAPFAAIRGPVILCDRATMIQSFGFPDDCVDRDATRFVLKEACLSRDADWRPVCGQTDPLPPGAVPGLHDDKMAPVPASRNHAGRVGQVRQ